MSITGAADAEVAADQGGVAISDILTGMLGAMRCPARCRPRAGGGPARPGPARRCLDPRGDAGGPRQPGTERLRVGRAPGRLGNAHPNIVPYETFETSGALAVAIGSGGSGRVCARHGPASSPRPRFATNGDRVENREALRSSGDLRRADHRDWIAALDAAGSVPINDIVAFASEEAVALA
jgi:crotonobetainyl-CoA:carnitine CoA-transferase CaiB-like acyl-CoA transferase